MTGQESRESAQKTVIPVLVAISVSHLLNDTLQSLIPAIYPIVKQSFLLSFSQVGLITFVFQVTASLLQPVVGAVTDRRPQPFSLAAGMGFTLIGLVVLSEAGSFGVLLFSVALVGIGSSIFHPESSRVAHLAAGDRRGFAQSFFQVGGNAGSSLGPLLAAIIIAGRGRSEVLWFAILAVVGIVILTGVGRWLGGLGSALLGRIADSTSIAHVYQLCAFLPLIGIVAAFLPNLETGRLRQSVEPGQ